MYGGCGRAGWARRRGRRDRRHNGGAAALPGERETAETLRCGCGHSAETLAQRETKILPPSGAGGARCARGCGGRLDLRRLRWRPAVASHGRSRAICTSTF
jgi:hypothetical protein